MFALIMALVSNPNNTRPRTPFLSAFPRILLKW